LIIALNKIDIIKPEDLPLEDRNLLQNLGIDGTVVPMSTMSEEGVMIVKTTACDKLLEQRVDIKLKGKKVVNILNRLHLATPIPRDDKERPPIERPGLEAIEMEEGEDAEKDLPEWMRGLNNQSRSWKKKYLLENEEWKFDVIPEIMDGKNIADFIDPEIMARLEELEKEEDERELENQQMVDDDDDESSSSSLDEEEKDLVEAIRARKKVIVQNHRVNKGMNRAALPRGSDSTQTTTDQLESHLLEMGVDPSRALERARSRSRSKSAPPSRDARKRARSETQERSKSRSRSRSVSKTPEPGEGFKNVKQKIQAEVIGRKAQRSRNLDAKRGEADRKILDMKPKHLFSGKRKSGSTQRR